MLFTAAGVISFPLYTFKEAHVSKYMPAYNKLNFSIHLRRPNPVVATWQEQDIESEPKTRFYGLDFGTQHFHFTGWFVIWTIPTAVAFRAVDVAHTLPVGQRLANELQLASEVGRTSSTRFQCREVSKISF